MLLLKIRINNDLGFGLTTNNVDNSVETIPLIDSCDCNVVLFAR